MDIVFDILLILHLVALGVGATTAIGMPIVMARMGGATPQGKQMLGGIAKRFGINSRIAVAVLVVTGVLMVAVRYGSVEAFNSWFWVKMALVALIVIAMVISAVAPRGSVNPAVLSWVTRLSLLGVVIAAVFAFN